MRTSISFVAALACGLCLSSLPAVTPSYQVMAAFPASPGGSSSGLVKMADGSLYGTASMGGVGGGGCVFKLQAGVPTVVANFATIGVTLDARVSRERLVVRGADLFGLATAADVATLWKWNATDGLVKLASFDGASVAGVDVSPGIVVSADGTAVYGICSSGGPASAGSLWKWTLANGVVVQEAFDAPSAITLAPRAIHSNADGSEIFGVTQTATGVARLWKWTEANGLTDLAAVSVTGMQTQSIDVAPNGAIYGVAADENASSYDTRPVKLWKWTSPATSVSVAATFTSASDVLTHLAFDASSNVHGLTRRGGSASNGTLWRLPAAGGAVTTLVSLPATAGKETAGALYLDTATGNITGLSNYRTTAPANEGVVWRWSAPSTVTVDATLSGRGVFGGEPLGIAIDSKGLVYGLSNDNDEHTLLWRLNGSTITVLATFSESTFGHHWSDRPVTIIFDAAGNLYGVTNTNAATTASTGVLWKWSPVTGLSKLATFGTSSLPGNPTGALVRDPATGTFYGLSSYSNVAVPSSGIFTYAWRCTAAGVVTNLGVLNVDTIGTGPGDSLVWSSGTLYGTTVDRNDGVTDGGMIWKWTAARGIEPALDESVDTNGFMPLNMIKHSDGTFYFTSSDIGFSVFRWDGDALSAPVQVASSSGPVAGAMDITFPAVMPLEAEDGTLFGVFNSGGTSNLGTLWSLDPQASIPEFTKLHDFDGNTGGHPRGPLMALAPDGSLFGVARDVVWRYGLAAPGGSALPVITGVASASISATGFTVGGTVNPSLAATTIWLEWGTAASNLANMFVPTPSTLAETDAATAVSAVLGGLNPATTYFYRIAARNVNGIAYSSTLSTKTAAATPPKVVTSAVLASTISVSGATLPGTVNPSGATVNVFFDYGLSSSALNTSVSAGAALSGTTMTPVTLAITGLMPHTKYYYRIRATGPMGSAVGSVLNFTTGNTRPQAFADTAAALPSAPVTIHVCSNDTDTDGDALTVYSVTTPATSQGTVKKVGGDLVFTPAATFAGPVVLQYVAADAFGGKSDLTAVTITLGTCTPVSTTINVDAGDASAWPALTVMPSAAQLSAASFQVSYFLDVTATAPFTLVESATWLSGVIVDDGTNKGVQFAIQPNTSSASRQAVVKVGGVNVTIIQAGVQSPSLDLSGLVSNGQVGAPYISALTIVNAPATITMTGTLPPGLKLYASSGIIAGVPTKNGDFTVTFKLSNAVGNSGAAQSFTFHIDSLPVSVQGAFAALVDAHSSINAGLGARVTFSVSTSAVLTGSLTVGGSAISFTGVANPAGDPTNYDAVSIIEIKRTGLPSYFLQINIDTAGIVTGGMWLATDPSTIAPSLGHRTLTTGGFDAKLASKYVSTLEVDLSSAGPGVPEGNGYLTLSVASNGAVTYGGKTADNTAITGSGIVGVSSAGGGAVQVLLHLPLYSGTGVHHGSFDLVPNGTDPSSVSGSSRWLKNPQPVSVRAYRSGFDVQTTIAGWQWIAKPTGTNVIEAAEADDNAQLSVVGGGVELASRYDLLNRTFKLTAGNVASFVSGAMPSNPASIALTPVNSTGLFTGKFTLVDQDGYLPTKTVTRTVDFSGVIVPGVNGPFGVGFFLLSKLQADADHPALPASPSSTTSQLSGLVTFDKTTSGF